MSDLFNQPCADVLVIGVGALGCAVAGRGALNDASEFPRQADWAAIHTQSSELFSTGLDQRLHVVLPAGAPNEDAIALVLEARADEWQRWCTGKRHVLVVACDDDGFAMGAAQAIADLLRESETALVTLCVGTETQETPSAELSVIRAVLAKPAPDVSPRAAEALQCANTLEIVESCLGALRAGSASSAWLSEPFADFLRWGLLDAQAGSAESVDGVLSALRGVQDDTAESIFLIVHGSDERSTAELTALRTGLCAAERTATSVLSVEGRSPGEGLFWLRIARRAQSSNVVRLDQARQAIAAVSFAKT